MFLNQLEFQRYIQASAKRGDLGVEWKRGIFPHTTGKKVVLPVLPASATIDDYRKLLHYVNHEVDHVLFTDFEQNKETKCDALRSFLGFIWNAIEDVRVEYLGGQEYEGDRANSDEVFEKIYDEQFKRIFDAAASMDAGKKELLERVLPIVWFMVKGQSNYYSSAHLVLPKIEKHMGKEAKERMEKLRDGDYLDVLRNLCSIEDAEAGTKASFELAKRIFEEVYGLDPEKELERLQQPPEGGSGKDKKPEEKGEGPKPKPAAKPKEKKDEEGDKGEAKPEDKDEKDGDKGEGKEGEGEGEKDEGEAQTASMGGDDGEGEEPGRDYMVHVKYQEFLPTGHEQKDVEDRISMPTAGMAIDYSGHRGSGRYVPATKDEFLVGDFCKGQFTDIELKKGQLYYMEEFQNALRSTTGNAFAARVRTRLQIRSKDRFEHGVKKGRLQNSLLHRVTVPNAPTLNERVFKRRIVNDTLDTAVAWLGDASGSMGGDKYGHLGAASAQFNEAVGNVLGVPIEITTFSDRGAQPLMYVHRDFATRRLPNDELLRRMAIAGNRMCGNPDGDAVMWVYDRLKQQKAKRKLLIVASDGRPACSRGGDIDWFTREVVRKIEDETPIEIVGIGIMDDNVSRIYKEHYVINDAAELEKALLALIDKKIR